MKFYTILFLTFIFAACSSTQPANSTNATNTANATNAAQNQSQSSAPSNLSPSETMLALNKASKEKNPAAVKSLVSKATLSMMEQSAKEQNKTVDEMVESDENAPTDDAPETRNEKINGDKATVEVKNKISGDWIEFPFVKEDGVWKAAIDQFVEQMNQKAMEETKQSPVETEKKKN